MIQLSPWAFGTVDDVLRHLSRTKNTSDEDRENAVEAANQAIGWMERRTARRLRHRTYRTAVDITGTWTTSARTVAGSGFLTDVKVDDLVLGVGIKPGTRVESVDSDVQITLSELPEVLGSSAALTVGGAPLYVDGRGSGVLYVPEWPATEVYSASEIDVLGNATALDLTGGRIGPQGLTYMIAGAFPEGMANIALSFAAGYRKPSATVPWDNHWPALSRLWLRTTEVLFLDRSALMGRRSMRHVQNTDVSWDWKMPDDIERAIEGYARKP